MAADNLSRQLNVRHFNAKTSGKVYCTVFRDAKFKRLQNLAVKYIFKRIVDIDLCCMEYGVKDVVISSIVMKM